MKKLFISFLFFSAGTALFFMGCTKETFDENYYNPEASVTANIPSLWGGLFFNEYVSPHYWNLYTFLIPMMGTYSQTIGYTNASKVYEQAVNYTQDRWNYYYTNTIARYREIEKYYNNLTTDEEKNSFQIYLETAKIFVYDQTARMVDMWGDIPFSTAGQLNAKGTITLPTYDKAADIYSFILTDLKRIADYLASGALGDLTQFTSFDYINNGDITKWRKYCNSLKLRLAMAFLTRMNQLQNLLSRKY